MADETSVDASVIPASTTPAIGTPGTGEIPETTQPPKSSIDDALKEIERLKNDLKKVHAESAGHRKKLSTYEEQEKLAQEAALSELDKSNKRAADAEAKIKQYQQQLVTAQVKLAAQSKGIIDPDLAALAIQSDLEYGDDGMPTNLDKALETLMKNKPYLVKVAEPAPVTPATSASGQRTAPAIPAMDPGRTSIPSPGTLPPGQVTRLSDLKWSR